jgi:DNA-binding transcriptional LysR family regulator
VSKSLRRLEQSMQAKLVERTPKGVALTAVGSALLAQVRRLRLTLQDIGREAADLSQGRAGHLRIGATAADCEYLPAAYSVLCARYPTHPEIIVTDTDVMPPLLRKGELTQITLIPERPYDGLDQEHLYEDEYVVCASADHRLVKQKRVGLADLVQEGWALSSANIPPQRILHRTFEDSALPAPRVVVETRSMRVRLQTWAHTDLLGYVSKRVLQQAAGRFRLTVLPVKELTRPRTVGAIYRKDAYLPPAARRLLDILKSTVEASPANGRDEPAAHMTPNNPLQRTR